MGFAAGELILEVGYGSDCDDVLRSEIVAITGTQLLEGEATEVVDAVIPAARGPSPREIRAFGSTDCSLF